SGSAFLTGTRAAISVMLPRSSHSSRARPAALEGIERERARGTCRVGGSPYRGHIPPIAPGALPAPGRELAGDPAAIRGELAKVEQHHAALAIDAHVRGEVIGHFIDSVGPESRIELDKSLQQILRGRHVGASGQRAKHISERRYAILPVDSVFQKDGV